MQTITSFPADAVPREELGGIVADYVALDEARVFRGLLVPRCAALALLAFVIGALVPGFSVLARVGSVALFLLPAVGAWLVELRLARRLSNRLERHEKVVKSS